MTSVLYVDDEPDLLEIGKLFLERTGNITVSTTGSGASALEILGTEQYDAIVADYQMPGMDGIALLKAVRARFGDIPFILFTGRGREEVVIEAINNGADSYLQKGGDPMAQFTELAHKIRQAARTKQADHALEESERRYRSVVETQTEFITRFRPDGTHLFVNEAYCRHFGKKRDEIVGHRFIPSVPPGDLGLLRNHFNSLTPGRPAGEIEHRVILPSGAVRWHLWTDHAFFDSGGEVTEYQSIGRDVTERKQSEEEIRTAYEKLAETQNELRVRYNELSENEHAIRESGEQFRTIFENSPYPIAINSIPDGRFISVNTAFLRSSGYTEAEVIGRTPTELGLLTLLDFGRLGARLLASGRIESMPMVLSGKGGIRVHVAFSTIPVTIGKKPAILTMAAEITKLKRVEEELLRKTEDLNTAYTNLAAVEGELRERFDQLKAKEAALVASEEKFRALIENSLDGILIISFSGILLFANPMVGRIMEIGDISSRAGRANVFSYIAPESHGDVLRDLGSVAAGTDSFLVSYRLVTESGRYIWVECIGKKIQYEGTAALLLSMRDTTQQKMTEDALRGSESRWRQVLEQSPVPMALYTLDGTVRFSNRQFSGIVGWTVDDIPHLDAWWTTVYPDSLYREQEKTAWLTRIEAAQKTGKYIEPLETRIFCRDGVSRILEFSGLVLGDSVLVTFYDLTARKHAEEDARAAYEQLEAAREELQAQFDALQDSHRSIEENEEKYRMLVEQSRDGICIIQDGRLAFYNRALAGLSGYSPEELDGKLLAELVAPEDQEMVASRARDRALGKPVPEQFELTLLHKDSGRRVRIRVTAGHGVYLGRPASFGTFYDVTEDRRREDVLRESEEKIRTILDNLPDLVVVHRDGIILYVNPVMQDAMGLRPEEVVNRPVTDLIAPEYHEAVMTAIRSRLEDHPVAPYEIEILSRNTKGRRVSVRGSLITFGGAPAILNVLTDLTGGNSDPTVGNNE